MGEPALLASDFWMAAHDRQDGRSYLRPHVLGIGLAAALLCELHTRHWFSVEEHGMVLHPQAATSQLPADMAHHEVLRLLIQEADVRTTRHRSRDELALPIGDWIAHLQDGVAQRLVEERLAKLNLVRQEVRRPLFRASYMAYVPIDPNTSGWPAMNISLSLRQGKDLSEQDLTLAGLLLATGMRDKLFSDLSSREFEFLGRQIAATMRISLRELVTCAEAAVSRLVMIR